MKQLKVIINKNPLFEKCPECGKYGTLHRSRTRNLWENILKATTIIRTYRCKQCGWRGYRSLITVTTRSFRVLLIYLFVILIVAYIVKNVVARMIG